MLKKLLTWKPHEVNYLVIAFCGGIVGEQYNVPVIVIFAGIFLTIAILESIARRPARKTPPGS